MTSSLAPGLELTREWTVSPAHLYNPTSIAGREVLSSPSMIMEMEQTCARLARQHLPASQTTVGFHVDVKHVAPARPGAAMATTARVESVDGRKITFTVEAREGERLVGAGKHRRAIITIE